MKKIIFAAVMGTMFICALAFSDTNLNKKHKGMEKEGQKINCKYCHTTAGNPKKGTDYAKYKKAKFCKGSGCH